MNVKKVLATAGFGVGIGAFLLAPAAALADVTVSPSVVRPGSDVSIEACHPGVSGHAEIVGPARMQTFDVDLQHGPTGANAVFTVPTGTASHGTWHVTATCEGEPAGSNTFTVSPTTGPSGGDGGATDNTALLAAGTALVGGGAAAGGLVLMRRRANSTT